MTDTTDRFALPLLQPGQAQKEMFHNDALAALDVLVQPAVEAIGLDTPPSTPESGQCWIVGDSPGGAWAGQAGQIAGWSAAGWRFVAPLEGATAWVISDALTARFRGGVWTLGEETAAHLAIGGDVVVRARQAAIADPTGGATVDTESRTAITAMLTALRAHGLIAG